MWLWPPLIQKELDKFMNFANHRRGRKQKEKVLPSGVTSDYAYTFPEHFGARNCLIPVDRHIIKEMMDDLEEEKKAMSDWGVDPEVAELAGIALARLGVEEVTMENVWIIFTSLLGVLEAV